MCAINLIKALSGESVHNHTEAAQGSPDSNYPVDPQNTQHTLLTIDRTVECRRTGLASLLSVQPALLRGGYFSLLRDPSMLYHLFENIIMIIIFNTSDLQKSRHLQKSRVSEQHNGRTSEN